MEQALKQAEMKALLQSEKEAERRQKKNEQSTANLKNWILKKLDIEKIKKTMISETEKGGYRCKVLTVRFETPFWMSAKWRFSDKSMEEALKSMDLPAILSEQLDYKVDVLFKPCWGIEYTDYMEIWISWTRLFKNPKVQRSYGKNVMTLCETDRKLANNTRTGFFVEN
jgi:hypothetical protein